MSERTAFVTGGTGFLGLHVVEALLAEGWRVVALHRATSDVSRLKERDVTLAQGSLEDRASLERAIPEGCAAVFHVAANLSLWSGLDGGQTRANVDGTQNVVEAAIARGVRRLVQTSSVAVWGRQERVPFDETAPKNGATSPINYARSKLQGEEAVKAAGARGLEGIVMNPCHIVGRYDVNGWSKMVTLVGNGKVPVTLPGRGCFCDARAVARAHVAAVTRGRPGENYLLGGPDVSYAEVMRTIGELVGRKPPRHVVPRWLLTAGAEAGELAARLTRKPPLLSREMVEGLLHEEVVDSSKAERELGYATPGLREMLEDALAWQVAQGMVRPAPTAAPS